MSVLKAICFFFGITNISACEWLCCGKSRAQRDRESENRYNPGHEAEVDAENTVKCEVPTDLSKVRTVEFGDSAVGSPTMVGVGTPDLSVRCVNKKWICDTGFEKVYITPLCMKKPKQFVMPIKDNSEVIWVCMYFDDSDKTYKPITQDMGALEGHFYFIGLYECGEYCRNQLGQTDADKAAMFQGYLDYSSKIDIKHPDFQIWGDLNGNVVKAGDYGVLENGKPYINFNLGLLIRKEQNCFIEIYELEYLWDILHYVI